MANQWLKQYCQFCISSKSAKATLTKAFSVMMLSACIVSGLNSSAHAGTTTADFLKWNGNQQKSFLQTSMSMLTTVAAQIKPDMAQCLDDWYYKESGLDKKRHAEIIKIMPQYTKFHPSTVILAYVENFCGKLE